MNADRSGYFKPRCTARDIIAAGPEVLPPSLQRLVPVIGLGTVAKLVEVAPDAFFRFPQSGECTSVPWRLACLLDISERKALSICLRLAGQTLRIPKAARLAEQLRNAKLRKDAAKVKRLSTLARRYQISERHVQRVLAEKS